MHKRLIYIQNIVFILATLCLFYIYNIYFSKIGKEVFSIDILFSLGVLVCLYFFRKTVHSIIGLTFILSGMLMNAAGIIGAYNLSLFGIGWDKYLHLIACSGIFLLVINYIKNTFSADTKEVLLSKSALYFIAICISITIGTLNEVNEFIGSELFGMTQGIFAVQNGTVTSTFDRSDGYWDLLFNTLSILTTAVLHRIYMYIRKEN